MLLLHPPLPVYFHHRFPHLKQNLAQIIPPETHDRKKTPKLLFLVIASLPVELASDSDPIQCD